VKRDPELHVMLQKVASKRLQYNEQHMSIHSEKKNERTREGQTKEYNESPTVDIRSDRPTRKYARSP